MLSSLPSVCAGGGLLPRYFPHKTHVTQMLEENRTMIY